MKRILFLAFALCLFAQKSVSAQAPDKFFISPPLFREYRMEPEGLLGATQTGTFEMNLYSATATDPRFYDPIVSLRYLSANDLALTDEQAVEIVNAYFETFPRVQRTIEESIKIQDAYGPQNRVQIPPEALALMDLSNQERQKLNQKIISLLHPEQVEAMRKFNLDCALNVRLYDLMRDKSGEVNFFDSYGITLNPEEKKKIRDLQFSVRRELEAECYELIYLAIKEFTQHLNGKQQNELLALYGFGEFKPTANLVLSASATPKTSLEQGVDINVDLDLAKEYDFDLYFQIEHRPVFDYALGGGLWDLREDKFQVVLPPEKLEQMNAVERELANGIWPVMKLRRETGKYRVPDQFQNEAKRLLEFNLMCAYANRVEVILTPEEIQSLRRWLLVKRVLHGVPDQMANNLYLLKELGLSKEESIELSKRAKVAYAKVLNTMQTRQRGKAMKFVEALSKERRAEWEKRLNSTEYVNGPKKVD